MYLSLGSKENLYRVLLVEHFKDFSFEKPHAEIGSIFFRIHLCIGHGPEPSKPHSGIFHPLSVASGKPGFRYENFHLKTNDFKSFNKKKSIAELHDGIHSRSELYFLNVIVNLKTIMSSNNAL